MYILNSMLIIFDILRNINNIIIISLLNSKTHHLHRPNWDRGTFHQIWEGRAELIKWLEIWRLNKS